MEIKNKKNWLNYPLFWTGIVVLWIGLLLSFSIGKKVGYHKGWITGFDRAKSIKDSFEVIRDQRADSMRKEHKKINNLIDSITIVHYEQRVYKRIDSLMNLKRWK